MSAESPPSPGSWPPERGQDDERGLQGLPPLAETPDPCLTPTLANETLESFGPAAIEKVALKNREGRVVKELFGYGLHDTLEAANEAPGPDGWRYRLIEWKASGSGSSGSCGSWSCGIKGSTSLSDEGDSFRGAI